MHAEETNFYDRSTINDLLRRGLKYKKSEEFFRFFNFIARFDHYSRYNTMLVYLQNPEVTFFGGEWYWWKKFKRRIKMGAKPYIILAPNGPVMLVYDVFDTEGKDLPEEFLKKGLGMNPLEVKGEFDEMIFDIAIREAQCFGINILYKFLSYFTGGYIVRSGVLEICLKEGCSKKENFAVLIHELAHLFLGHTCHKELHYRIPDGSIWYTIKLKHRPLSITMRELEAETVSFLVCKKVGVEPRAAEYIAMYIHNEEELNKFNYEVVIKTTDKLESIFLIR